MYSPIGSVSGKGNIIKIGQMHTFSPIDFDFDQTAIYNALLNFSVFDRSDLATVIYSDGRSKYDKDGIFEDYQDVVHYDENSNLVKQKYKTFVTYNFTHLPGVEDTINNSFVDTDIGRRPVWHVYDQPWQWKDDTPACIKETVEQLDLTYISCVRLVGQTPPSKGIVHVDANFKDNLKYYKNGGVSITLNVSDGGGHLEYKVGEEIHTVDESKYKCWYFNDALPHRTTEIFTPRIQLRIFGRK